MIATKANPSCEKKLSTHEQYLGKTIFIIDDEQIMIDLISQILQGVGYHQIHGFTKSTEALELLRFVTPDLILTDIHMPDLSGTFFAKLVSEFPQFVSIPLLAVTGDDSVETQEQAVRNGIFDVVHKPVDNHDLLDKILKTLDWAEFAKSANQELRNDATQKRNTREHQVYRAFHRRK